MSSASQLNYYQPSLPPLPPKPSYPPVDQNQSKKRSYTETSDFNQVLPSALKKRADDTNLTADYDYYGPSGSSVTVHGVPFGSGAPLDSTQTEVNGMLPPPSRPTSPSHSLSPYQSQKARFPDDVIRTSTSHISNSSSYHESTMNRGDTARCNTNFRSIATSAISFNDTVHGRSRRIQRQIPRRDVQEAIKYGTSRPCPYRPGVAIYEYNGKKHVLDKTGKDLITSMTELIELPKRYITHLMEVEHKDSREKIRNDKSWWTSHCVLIVDKSGSMRHSDVSGSRTRLGAVWHSIAQDFGQFQFCDGNSLVLFFIVLFA